MLELNPRAADIPEQGPSPLQVAVRHYASVEVCSLLIQACPLALMATHSGYDPLMYAKASVIQPGLTCSIRYYCDTLVLILILS